MRSTSLAAALTIALFVSACGTKGPLYLTPKTSASAPTPPTPATQPAPVQPATDANTAPELH